MGLAGASRSGVSFLLGPFSRFPCVFPESTPETPFSLLRLISRGLLQKNAATLRPRLFHPKNPPLKTGALNFPRE